MGRQHEGVGAERQRVLRQVGVEAEMRAPGAVHEQRHAGRPAALGDGGHVRQHAHVGRLRQEHRAGAGMRGQRVGDALGRHPAGRPVRGSSSGRTNTGFRPPSTKAANSDLWMVRDTITVAPGRATPSAMAWLAWLEPFTTKRHQSAPQARRPGLRPLQHALALAQVVDGAGQRQVERQEGICDVGVAAVAGCGE